MINRVNPLPVLAGIVILLIAGCTEGPAEISAAAEYVRPAKVHRVSTNDSSRQHRFVGRVDAAQTVDMSFQVPGLLAAFKVLEGQEIEAGSALASLDPEDYALAVREAEVQLNIAQQDLQRKQSLLKDKGISESSVDDARALRDLRQVRLEQAIENLEDTKLQAPFQGYVSKRFVDANVNIAAGQPVLRLLDLNTLNVVASIPEDLVATVTADRINAINARFAFAPNMTFPLVPLENAGEAGNVAQTFDVTFQMARPIVTDDSPGWNILPGMTATVEVLLRGFENAAPIIIPESALVAGPAENQFQVWMFDADSGGVTPRQVQIGPLTDAGVVIVGGLSPDELIIAAGANQLLPGMRVRPLNQDF